MGGLAGKIANMKWAGAALIAGVCSEYLDPISTAHAHIVVIMYFNSHQQRGQCCCLHYEMPERFPPSARRRHLPHSCRAIVTFILLAKFLSLPLVRSPQCCGCVEESSRTPRAAVCAHVCVDRARVYVVHVCKKECPGARVR